MPPKPTLPRVAVVLSRYNASVTSLLLTGALHAYSQRHFPTAKPTRAADKIDPRTHAHVETFPASGAFEILPIAAAAAKSGRFDAVVALGCIIKGETAHDLHLASAVTTTLAQLSASGGPAAAPFPVGLGVLTVNTPKQALARAGGKLGNKGAEAMLAALDTLQTLRLMRSPKPQPTRASAPANSAPLLPSPRTIPDKAAPAKSINSHKARRAYRARGPR